MRIESLASYTVGVHTHTALLSADRGDELAENLFAVCCDVGRMLNLLSNVNAHSIRIWVSLDRHESSAAEYTKFSQSNIDIRIDAPCTYSTYERHFIGIGMTLKNPGAFDRLRGGRAPYQEWLRSEFLRIWRDALREVAPDQYTILLRNTIIWVFRQAPPIYTYNHGDRAICVERALGEPETAFAGPHAILGPGVFDAELSNEK
ncbi:MAG TPA: hypothetical protein VFC78_22460 [Tepidisphaeraceae bacterium]|nr:hypothetical protein [Tepidisphaeraceae bacterium]